MDLLVDYLLNFYGPTPYLIVFGVLMACGLGVPMPEDIILFAAGLLSYYGVSHLSLMIVVSLLGVILGDSLIFVLGATYGRKLTKKWLFHRLLPDDRLEMVKKKFHERGNKLIFAARFMPGFRAPIFFSAGTLHLPYKVFLFYDGMAALISVPAIIGAVYYFGDELDKVVRVIQRIENGIVLLIFSIIAAFAIKWFLSVRAKKKAALGLLLAFSLLSAPVFSGCKKKAAPPLIPQVSTLSDGSGGERIQKFCTELNKAVKEHKWAINPCENVHWKEGGTSIQGRPLVFAEFGNPSSENKTLIISMVHGDEITPLYLGLKAIGWMNEHLSELSQTHIIIAPLVNPDSYFHRPRTRVNARGVDVNRNFETRDWSTSAHKAWKNKFRSDPRRFPGHTPRSEPETIFQEELIRRFKPNKILSVHAPLNFLDYDGPSNLSLDKFPSDYVNQCVKLRNRLKAVSGGFFPGSLGNFAGQELGIPTLTLELPSANPAKADEYWKQFSTGIRTMIFFTVPSFASGSKPLLTPSQGG